MRLTIALKVLVALYLASSYKSLPLAYFFRFFNQVFQLLIVPYIKKKLGFTVKLGPPIKNEGPNLAIFTPQVFKTYNSPFECDMFFHKSNSTYFTELDIVRTRLMCTIFGEFFLQYYGRHGSFPYVPVSAVQATFKKEIKPYSRYNVVSRIVAWDNKWIFILSKFILPGQNDRTSCTAITRYILKQGRKTIEPREAMKACGLYSKEAEEISQKNFAMVEDFLNTGDIQDVDLYIPEVIPARD
ncbi:hypothetical protein DASC09_044430 [Saccharomycopsis crataegensis]|uniref:Uncharacterized protein n=1 Tax=Saccharomycopsis crataegensis TaxID=43959 RepID=A0AAV5QQP3_9ASCO|nr:hypothetical protein DASC09_044430 [Saccharomycopsis crataegensis]